MKNSKRAPKTYFFHAYISTWIDAVLRFKSFELQNLNYRKKLPSLILKLSLFSKSYNMTVLVRKIVTKFSRKINGSIKPYKMTSL